MTDESTEEIFVAELLLLDSDELFTDEEFDEVLFYDELLFVVVFEVELELLLELLSVFSNLNFP